MHGKATLLRLLLAGALLAFLSWPTRTDGSNDPTVYTVDALLTGGPGDPTYGDLFGVPSTLLSAKGRHKARAVIGALYANGNPFPNGTAMPNAGKHFYFEDAPRHAAWTQFQPPYIGRSAYNQDAGTTIHAGAIGRRHGGARRTKDQWLFVPEAGTPLDVSDPSLKDRSGNLNVFKLDARTGTYAKYQSIANPNGNGPAQDHAEFGINFDYTPSGGGWLVVGGGITNTVWFIIFDTTTNLWTPVQSVTTGPQKGNLIVAVSGRYAFLQNATDFSAPGNLEVLVYKRTGSAWAYSQTLRGYANEGANASFIGDLFGSPMAIDCDDDDDRVGHDDDDVPRCNALLGAPGDATYPGDIGLGGAAYFASLSANGLWRLTQKVFSDSPTLFYGFGGCLMGDTAFVADTGRTVGANLYQGALREYRLFDSGVWVPGQLLIHPNGDAYDYFSVCTMSSTHLLGASFRAATQFLGMFVGPALPGKVVIWDRDR